MIEFERLEKVAIIAEIGSNHDGKLSQATDLIREAAAAGADAVKFQLFVPEKLYPAKVANGGRFRANPKIRSLKKYQLNPDWLPQLKKTAESAGVDFLCTPFDPQSAQLLNGLGVKAFKVASGDLTYKRLLERICSFNKPIILSTGMATLKEIDEAVGLIQSLTCAPLILLHCVSLYPAQPQTLNLHTIPFLADRYGLPVGFSDHSTTIESSVAAVALGARVIEKHVTISRKLKGPDHPFALELDEFARLVEAIRNTEAALGEYTKKVDPKEYPERFWARRGIYAARDIDEGSIVQPSDVMELRPAEGISAWEIHQLAGKRLLKNKRAMEAIDREEVR